MSVTDNSHTGPFATTALQYLRANVSVIPTGGPNGKVPQIKGYMRFAQRQPKPATIQVWQSRFPDANVGILAGIVSNLTIVDLDRPDLLDDACKEFGETPLITPAQIRC